MSSPLPMLIVGGNSLHDAIATDPAMPLWTAIDEAKAVYRERTGRPALHLHLTEHDACMLLADSDFQQAFRYMDIAADSHPDLPFGVPCCIRGLHVLPLP